MAQILALEWDTNQVRFALATLRGNSTLIEQAFSISLAASSPEESLDQAGVGRRITAELAARGISHADCLVAVGRSSIELRLLSLPPAPAEELPGMVRFQASQEFAALGEDWPLDFFPVEGSSEQGQSVLAAAISPELVAQVKQTCQAAGLQPSRLLLRPCAAASLLRRQTQGDRRLRLMVELLTDEADLTVLKDQTVVFMRTARLPGEEGSDNRTRALVGEIRRTIAAAQNQLGGQMIEVVILYGTSDDHAVVRNQITQDLSLEVEIFDPFSGLQLGRELKKNLPDHPGCFAPLLGMLLDEAAENRPAIDFLHPRQKPPPPSNRRLYTVVASVAATVVFVISLGLWWHFGSLKTEVRTLTEKLNSLEETAVAAKTRRDDLAEIENWMAGDISWIDELRSVSEKLLPAEDVKITNLVLSSANRTMSLKGVVREFSLIRKMEAALQDKRFEVRGNLSREDHSDSQYPWLFDETISINTSQTNEAKPSSPDQSTEPVSENPVTENTTDSAEKTEPSEEDAEPAKPSESDEESSEAEEPQEQDDLPPPEESSEEEEGEV